MHSIYRDRGWDRQGGQREKNEKQREWGRERDGPRGKGDKERGERERVYFISFDEIMNIFQILRKLSHLKNIF